MGSHETSTALLTGLEQVTVKQQARAEECCGFGGTFSIRYPDISEAIVSDKVASLRETGAERVVSADCGCLFNILGRAARLDEIAGASVPTLSLIHIYLAATNRALDEVHDEELGLIEQEAVA